ncbi:MULTISPECIES: peptidyl-prolyl cis-trans isomerase [Sporosarcina]|uniref:peptidyl-prolyl cis-trans isomerase n=1 Tax=Sporosarcina TaxID=1569 RepID=UPI00058B615D|nr:MULTISPECIES: peptidyl-prolyl cis-trans isomerase [Sporosarcina]WJY26710.1 peptidyl-prolyl cis-trans isomerase [Sporosarcina sp. 0.2-SM1T-5]
MNSGRVPDRSGGAQPKRRLKTGPLLLLIAILAAGNLLWFIGWLIPDKAESPFEAGEEVASVAGKPITREEWMMAMEQEVGRDVLLGLVNERVMETAADEYKIKVTDEEVDRELALLSSSDGKAYTGLDAEQMRKKVRSDLILDSVLTKDIVVEDEAVSAYYKKNKDQYEIPSAHRTSLLAASTKEDAEQAAAELKGGSSFSVLAKERSVDPASASIGGDLGFISSRSEETDPAIVKQVESMKAGDTSGIIRLSDGTYGILHVKDVLKGRSFKLKDVKEHIRRELALQQLSQSVTPETFWQEFDAHWFYGN